MIKSSKELFPEPVLKNKIVSERQKTFNSQMVDQDIINISSKLKNLLKDISDGFFMLNNKLQFLFINQAAKILLHPVNGENLIGKELGEAFPKNSMFFQELHKAYRKQIPAHFEYFPTNTKKCLEIEVFPDKEGLVVYLHDSTFKKRSEQRQIHDYVELTDVLDRISDAFFSLDRQWRFIYLNNAAGEFFSKSPSQLKGKTIWSQFPQLSSTLVEERFITALEEQVSLSFETKEIINEGWYEIHVFPSEKGISVYAKNINERKYLETEISRLDRLNSVGEMATSIGHEIRNPMTTVRGFLQIIGENEECLKFKDSFSLMIDELDRCNSIISEFLSFAKKREAKFEWCNLISIIEAIKPLTLADAAISDKNVIFELETVPDLFLDPNEIRQLVLNLTRNGLEAMSPGKTLLIKTFQEENKVVLLVKDQGCGIDSAVIDKIGTPFVTTKENGTGLGLAVCYRIASRNNAVINFETGKEGTTFFVRFAYDHK